MEDWLVGLLIFVGAALVVLVAVTYAVNHDLREARRGLASDTDTGSVRRQAVGAALSTGGASLFASGTADRPDETMGQARRGGLTSLLDALATGGVTLFSESRQKGAGHGDGRSDPGHLPEASS